MQRTYATWTETAYRTPTAAWGRYPLMRRGIHPVALGAGLALAGLFLLRSPFFLIFMALWGGHRLARRMNRRHAAWRRTGPARRARSGWDKGLDARAANAHGRTRQALVTCDAISEREREELLATLDRSHDQVRSLERARRELARDQRPSEADDLLRRARDRVQAFERDCEQLRASLAAIQLADVDTSALDDLSRAAERLGGRVVAAREVA